MPVARRSRYSSQTRRRFPHACRRTRDLRSAWKCGSSGPAAPAPGWIPTARPVVWGPARNTSGRPLLSTGSRSPPGGSSSGRSVLSFQLLLHGGRLLAEKEAGGISLRGLAKFAEIIGEGLEVLQEFVEILVLVGHQSVDPPQRPPSLARRRLDLGDRGRKFAGGRLDPLQDARKVFLDQARHGRQKFQIGRASCRDRSR